MTYRVADGGRQVERTALSWRRTATAMVVMVLAVLRFAFTRTDGAGIVTAAALLGGALFIVWGPLHERRHRAGASADTHHAHATERRVMAATIGTVVVALCAFALLFAPTG